MANYAIFVFILYHLVALFALIHLSAPPPPLNQVHSNQGRDMNVKWTRKTAEKARRNWNLLFQYFHILQKRFFACCVAHSRSLFSACICIHVWHKHNKSSFGRIHVNIQRQKRARERATEWDTERAALVNITAIDNINTHTHTRTPSEWKNQRIISIHVI